MADNKRPVPSSLPPTDWHAEIGAGQSASLQHADPEVAALASAESDRQRASIYLAAASSVTPAAVLEALTTPFTNLDVEGYSPPGLQGLSTPDLLDVPARERSYLAEPKTKFNGGTAVAELVEELAKRRATELFDPSGSRQLCANVQAATGAIAVTAALRSAARPGQTILALGLSQGGHLSHGSGLHLNGELYRMVPYGLTADETQIDYEQVDRLVDAEAPAVLIAGCSSFPNHIDWSRLARAVSKSRNRCALLADISHVAGLVAGDCWPSPIAFADLTVFATYKTLLGPRGAVILAAGRDLGERVDRALFPWIQSAPITGHIPAIAVCLGLARTAEYRLLQQRICRNALALAKSLASLGVPLAFGGTQSHMVVIDGRGLNADAGGGLPANEFARYLEASGIVANMNVLPGDSSGRSPRGIRLGTTWVSQMGMGVDEMGELGDIIATALSAFMETRDGGNLQLEKARLRSREAVDRLLGRFSIPLGKLRWERS